jgi:hypothetical protein
MRPVQTGTPDPSSSPDGAEVSHPEEVLLLRAEEAFGTAVVFEVADQAG